MQRKSMRAQSAARRITFTLAALISQASSLTPKPRVVVVGGGVGGLATAGRLQRLGAECTVLEKNEKLGGRVGEHRWEGHRWETGASLLLLPDVYRRALEAAGGAMVDAVRVDPAYAVWFREHADRGPVVLGGGDRGALRARLELEAPGAFERFERYGASTSGPAGPSSSRRTCPSAASRRCRASSRTLSRTSGAGRSSATTRSCGASSPRARACGRSAASTTCTWA